MEDRSQFRRLRLAYDTAFEQLRFDVEALGISECDELRRRVREAEAEYRLRRDELADFIMKQQEDQLCATCGR